MTDNPTPNDIALLREAAEKAARLIRQMHQEQAWCSSSVAETLVCIDAALAPGQHDGAAGEGLREALKRELERQCGIGAGTFTIDEGYLEATGLWQINADLDPHALFGALHGRHDTDCGLLYDDGPEECTCKPAPTEQARAEGVPWWSEPWKVGSEIRFSSGMASHTGHMCAPVSITSVPHVAPAFWVNAENAKKAIAMLEAAYAAGLANGLAAAGDDAVGGDK